MMISMEPPGVWATAMAARLLCGSSVSLTPNHAPRYRLPMPTTATKTIRSDDDLHGAPWRMGDRDGRTIAVRKLCEPDSQPRAQVPAPDANDGHEDDQIG